MNFQERKKKILTALEEAGSLTVFELAGILDSSPATIRRDLGDMAEEGLLIRTHGGAMKIENPKLTGFSEKSAQNNPFKELIAEKAAAYVHDGDTIFLDCGSTVFQMCRFLKQKSIRVITNSLPVLSELIDVPSIQINLIGGELNKARKAIHGDRAIQHINGYHADKAFIGVDGLSAQNGLTAHSEHESTITDAFIRNAGKIMLLCDASKIGKDSYVKFADPAAIQVLITDVHIDKGQQDALQKLGLQIEIAG